MAFSVEQRQLDVSPGTLGRVSDYESDNPREMFAPLFWHLHFFFTSWLLSARQIPLLKESFLSHSPRKVPALCFLFSHLQGL